MDPLNVVIIDAVPAVGFEVAKLFIDRGCNVDVLSAASAAVGALSARRRAGCPALLVLANHALPDTTAPDFAKHLLSRDPALAVFFYADLRFLPKPLIAAVQGAGGNVLNWPFDPAQVDQIVAGVQAHAAHAAPAQPPAAPPAQHATTSQRPPPPEAPVQLPRQASSGTRPAAPQPGQPGEALQRKVPLPQLDPPPSDTAVVRGSAQFADATGSARRTPSPIGEPASDAAPAADPHARPGSLSARRALNLPPMRTPLPGGPVPGAAPPAGAGAGTGSAFARRSVTGVASASRQMRQLKCPHCSAGLMAEMRAEAYGLPCPGCGTLLRIDPP